MVPVMALTATASPALASELEGFLHDLAVFKGSVDRPSIIFTAGRCKCGGQLQKSVADGKALQVRVFKLFHHDCANSSLKYSVLMYRWVLETLGERACSWDWLSPFNHLCRLPKGSDWYHDILQPAHQHKSCCIRPWRHQQERQESCHHQLLQRRGHPDCCNLSLWSRN